MVAMAKKREERKPTRAGRPLTVWLDSGVMDALDKFLEEQRFPSSKTGVIETLLRELLAREGYLGEVPPKETK